jgi:hypothetical protein
MAESPADVLRRAEAEFHCRAQKPHFRKAERDQFAALAAVFGHLAADMEFGGARQFRRGIPATPMVIDSEGHDRPEWADYLAAARAWLVPIEVTHD